MVLNVLNGPCAGVDSACEVTSLDVLLHGVLLGTAAPEAARLSEYRQALREGVGGGLAVVVRSKTSPIPSC